VPSPTRSSPVRPGPRVELGPEVPDLEDNRRSPLRLLGRIAVVVLVLGLVLMWIYALWFPQDVPGRLADPAFAKAAQPICQATMDRIAALPKSIETPDAVARAGVVDRGTAEIERMITDLRAVVPATGPERDIATQWLDDYATYASDRREYTAALRVDPTTRFAVTQSDRDKKQITYAIDHFAQVNPMPACVTPGDVA
jgi:hypothetical protein